VKNEVYPKDEDFFSQIASCSVVFSNSANQMFFRRRLQFYNDNTKKIEEILIFYTDFQLKLLSESKEIYMDGTFRTSPPKYQQLFNIIVYNDETKSYIPVVHT